MWVKNNFSVVVYSSLFYLMAGGLFIIVVVNGCVDVVLFEQTSAMALEHLELDDAQTNGRQLVHDVNPVLDDVGRRRSDDVIGIVE